MTLLEKYQIVNRKDISIYDKLNIQKNDLYNTIKDKYNEDNKIIIEGVIKDYGK